MDINRKTAYLALMDVETKKSFSNLAINHQVAVNRPHQVGFVRELVYGVLENKLRFDFYIDKLVRDGIKSLKAPEKTILRMGIHQIAHMDSVPDYAAVNECGNLAKKYCKSKAGLINGVLRGYISKKDQFTLPDKKEDLIKHLSIKYSYAPWIIQLWLDYYDKKLVEKLLEAGNEKPPTTIRMNWLKIMKPDLMAKLEEAGFEVEEGKHCANAINVKGSNLLDSHLYEMGLFSIQDESSMMVSEMLNPQHNEIIMDVCAAPGGKTMAIAERMNNTGKIIASDIYRRKLEQIEKDAERLGVYNVETLPWDATRVNIDMVEAADRVLVDAPCSGLGVIRRKPEIKYKEYSGELQALPRKQLPILSASSKYVKQGGTLVYSTCTINPKENEEVISTFLKRDESFSKKEEKLLLPNVDGTDGFYICVMKKN